jgi:hypothetical protein
VSRELRETAARLDAVQTPLPEVEVVVTRRTFAASPLRTWNGLIFYEQVERRAPLLLRRLLPRPLRTEGRKSEIGAAVNCVYDDGYLVKRITAVEPPRRYEFEISEQALEINRGIRLLGGSYVLHELRDGRTEVALTTRFWSPRRPRWLWKRMEAALCHRFHSFILSAMRERVESGGGSASSE